MIAALSLQSLRYSKLGLASIERRRRSVKLWKQAVKALERGDVEQMMALARQRSEESAGEAARVLGTAAGRGAQLAALISEAGLGGRELRKAGLLSHGEQRQLEIAMVLATDARVLLLDEPLAGMGSEESAQMVELLRKLKQNRAILLVEHDMDAVFAVADTITVMVEGSVLESGPPEQIRNSEDVQAAYLGEDEHG